MLDRGDLSKERQAALKGNLWRIRFTRSLQYSGGFVIPVIMARWQAGGVSLSDGLLLQAIFSVTMLVLDLPTGYMADRVGRKTMMMTGALALWAGSAFYLSADSFAMFLAGEIVFGFGFSCISGADEALFYDTLAELGEPQEFSRGWGKVGLCSAIYTAIASTLDGFLASFNILYPSVAEFVLLSFLPLFVSGISEPESGKRSGKERQKAALPELWALAKECLLARPEVRFLILYPITLMAFCQVAVWYYQPWLELRGFNLAQIGMIFAGMQVVCGLSSHTAAKLDKDRGVRFRIWAPLIAVAAGYILMGLTAVMAGAVFLVLQQWMRGFVQVAWSAPLNEMIPSSKRATIISLKSMVFRAAYMSLLFTLSGAGNEDPAQTMIFLGVATVLAGSVVLFVFAKGAGEERLVPERSEAQVFE